MPEFSTKQILTFVIIGFPTLLIMFCLGIICIPSKLDLDSTKEILTVATIIGSLSLIIGLLGWGVAHAP